MIRFSQYRSEHHDRGGYFEGSTNKEWNLNEPRSLHESMRDRPETCHTLEASGEELSTILQLFANIPYVRSASIVVWHGDWAQFIARNFRL